jgi:hypothetical protein
LHSHPSLSNHITDVLQLAVFGTDQRLALMALVLLQSDNPKIVAAAVESTFFEVYEPQILTIDADHSDRRISVFASLTDTCLSLIPVDLMCSFPFFCRFLCFTDNCAVRLTIIHLLQYNEEFKPLYAQLRDMHFTAKLVRQIKECQVAQVDGDRLSSLFEILVHCLRNRKLRESCLDPIVIAVVTDIALDKSADVLNWQWEALSELGASLYTTDQERCLQLAVGVVAGALSADRLAPFCVSAIDFISKLVRFAPEAMATADVPALARTVAGICTRFPNHGIGVRAVMNLVIAAVRKHGTSEAFFAVFAPACPRVLANRANPLRPFAMSGMRRIMDLAEGDPALEERLARHRDFVECVPAVRAFEDALEHEYGGKFPTRIMPDSVTGGLVLRQSARLHEIIVT